MSRREVRSSLDSKVRVIVVHMYGKNGDQVQDGRFRLKAP